MLILNYMTFKDSLNFIKGEYVEFSNDLNLCINIGYLSSNKYAYARYKKIEKI